MFCPCCMENHEVQIHKVIEKMCIRTMRFHMMLSIVIALLLMNITPTRNRYKAILRIWTMHGMNSCKEGI